MKLLNCEQGSLEWKQARLGVPSASRFADILAKTKSGYSASRANYMIELALEQITQTPTASFSSAAMQRGTELEPQARIIYASAKIETVVEVGFCLHDTINAGASPDALVDDDGGLEIKCPQNIAHLEYLQLPHGECPAKYKAQIQGGMWITGRKWWDFVSFNPDFPENLQYVEKRIVRDEAYIAQLEQEVILFNQELSEMIIKINRL